MSREPAPFRGVIIGMGNVARTAHLPGYRRKPAAPRLEIVGAVDSAAPPGALIEGIPTVPHRDQIEKFGPIDFVDICTPTSSHLDLCLWALERGYHVLCEKPVAIRARDAQRIAIAARQARRVVMPCHQYRFNPAWLQVRSWLESGVIGEWSLAEFMVYRPHADQGDAKASLPWRATRALGLGGVLLDHGTHLIYEVLDVAGPPAEVRGWTTRIRHNHYDVEDTAHLVLGYPDRMAVLFLTWAARHRETRIRFVGERGTIRWEGGLLHLSAGERSETLDFTAQLDKSSYAGWFSELFGVFAERMESRDGLDALADIARVAAVLEEGYRPSVGTGFPRARRVPA